MDYITEAKNLIYDDKVLDIENFILQHFISKQREDLAHLLISLYKEPHRKYHNLDHINDMVTRFLVLGYELDIPENQVLPALDIILWHDAIYYPQSKMNEELSMMLWRFHNQHNEGYASLIMQGILATKDHTSKDNDSLPIVSKLILDLDLCGLALEDKYNINAKNIFIEARLSGIDFDTFIKGRLKFLEKMLKPNVPIFRILTYLEPIARKNMGEEELNMLKSGNHEFYTYAWNG